MITVHVRAQRCSTERTLRAASLAHTGQGGTWRSVADRLGDPESVQNRAGDLDSPHARAHLLAARPREVDRNVLDEMALADHENPVGKDETLLDVVRHEEHGLPGRRPEI